MALMVFARYQIYIEGEYMFTITKYDAKIGIRCQGYPSEFMVTAEQMSDLLVEAIARMDSKELISFVDTFINKWPILADKVESMLGVGLVDDVHDVHFNTGENYGGTD